MAKIAINHIIYPIHNSLSSIIRRTSQNILKYTTVKGKAIPVTSREDARSCET
jgi:hypothetical protein